MKLQSLVIENFLSFAQAKVSLDDRGLVLIEGVNRDDPSAQSNGAGKSTVIEALVWCLYGTTLRGYEGDDVIHRSEKACAVRLTLKDDAHSYSVLRTRNDPTHRNALRLTRDKVDITGPSIAATQEMIDKLLGMTVTTFLNSVVFGQSAAYRFSLLTDKEQKAILDEIMGTAQYTRAAEVAREERRTLGVLLTRLTADQTAAAQDVARVEADIADLTDRQARFDDEKRAQARDLKEKLVRLKGEVVKLLRAVPTVPKTDTASLRRDRKGLEATVARLTMQVAEAKAEIRTRTAQKETLVHVVEHDAGVPCAECGQEIAEEHRTTLSEKVAALDAECAELKTRVVALERQRTDALREIADVTDRIDAAKHADHAVALAESKVEALERQRALLRDQLDTLRATVSPYQPMVEKAQQMLEEHRATLAIVVAALEKARGEGDRLDFWIDGFGSKGVRALLIDTVLPFLNDKAADYSRVLSDGTLSVEFKTQTTLKSGKEAERFEVSVVNEHGASSYKGNSAGERAKIDLIVGLSLQALACARAERVNVVFFDEPFESLDDTAVERVVALLSDVFREYASVFVITHNDALKAHFTDHMTVVKERGYSRLEHP